MIQNSQKWPRIKKEQKKRRKWPIVTLKATPHPPKHHSQPMKTSIDKRGTCFFAQNQPEKGF